MSLHALAFFAAELVGAGIVAGIATMVVSAWWRSHDRRQCERLLRREVQAEARRAAR